MTDKSATSTAKVDADLAASESRLRSVLDTVIDGIITIDDDGIIESFNPAAAKMFGRTAEEVIGRNVGMLMAEPHRAAHAGYLSNYVKTGEGKIIGIGREVEGRRKDGSVFPIDLAVSEFRVDDRRMFTGILRDITRIKRADQLATQFGRLLDDSLNEIYIFDAQTLRFIQVNRGGRENLGYSMEELDQLTPLDLKPEFTPASFEDLLTPLRDGGSERIQFSTVHRRKDGSTYDVEVHLQLSSHRHPFEEGGEKQAFLAFVVDVTERIQLQDQLLQAQKMESVGQLAGGIAHDFNNQLGIILFDVDMLIAATEESTPFREDLQKIRKTVLRSANLTRQLLVFSRRQRMDPRPMSLNEQIQEQQKMLGRLLGADVAVQLALDEDLLRVSADPASVDQVIVNLCINARDAMPQGGTLTVETSNLEVTDAYCRQHPQATAGEYVMLAVSDTGIGMEQAVRSRIFEPFFTTKEVGKGTGLGLSMVYGIVEAHKGWISVYSTPGEGTRFEVYLPPLPRAGVESAAAEPSISVETEMGRGERILILEDEPELRQRTAQMLEQRGYTVTACESLAHAGEACADGGPPYDLMIADVVLADGRGPDFTLNFTARFPKASVVLITGYSQETIHLQGRDGREIPVLYKPFSVADLLDLMREELDRV